MVFQKGHIVPEEWREVVSKAHKGKQLSEEHKKKISLSNSLVKGRKKTQYEKDAISVGVKHTYETGKKVAFWKGKEMPDSVKEKISKGQLISYQRIIDEIPELEKQGFRCVPVGGKIRPDIIAIKDGNIFAVEVEYNRPNYDKYTEDTKKYFDDIIWILRRDG